MLNLVEICTVKFPGQIEAGNITFRIPEDEILFDRWTVPNISKPTEAEILAQEPAYVRPFAVFQAFSTYLPYIDNLLNTTAQARQYGSAVACASYANSTNPQWAAEAAAFISWRDAVFVYAINVQTEVAQGGDIPDFETFIAGIPVIQWP